MSEWSPTTPDDRDLMIRDLEFARADLTRYLIGHKRAQRKRDHVHAATILQQVEACERGIVRMVRLLAETEVAA